MRHYAILRPGNIYWETFPGGRIPIHPPDTVPASMDTGFVPRKLLQCYVWLDVIHCTTEQLTAIARAMVSKGHTYMPFSHIAFSQMASGMPSVPDASISDAVAQMQLVGAYPVEKTWVIATTADSYQHSPIRD